MDDILLTLKAKGYKITSQRRAVVNALLQYEHFATAQQLLEDVKESNPDISLDTIYRILGLLMKLDKVHKVDMKNSEGAVFELIKDGHHHHLICLSCNKVLEFCDPRIQQINTTMGDLLGFTVSHHSLHLYANPIVDEKNMCKSCNLEVINKDEQELVKPIKKEQQHEQ